MPQCCVDKLVYSQEQKAIFRTFFIKVDIFYAYVSFSVGLFDHDDISQPIGVSSFSNEIDHK